MSQNAEYAPLRDWASSRFERLSLFTLVRLHSYLGLDVRDIVAGPSGVTKRDLALDVFMHAHDFNTLTLGDIITQIDRSEADNVQP